jgi:hypothetical protein
MALEQAEIERQIVAELGERRAAGLKANATRRVCGLLTRNNSDWDTAFEHIRAHFQPITDPAIKSRHTVFAERYRNKDALLRLLMRAASKPSRVRLTRLTIGNQHIGRPAVEIVRNFAEVIGDDSSLTALRIFTDYQGRLMTAYPGRPDSPVSTSGA